MPSSLLTWAFPRTRVRHPIAQTIFLTRLVALYEAFTALAGNHFCSAYVESSRKEVACTLHTDKEKAARAFLFYQARGLRVVPRSARAYSSNNPLPNVLWPSTHFPLVCDFYNVTPR